MMNQLRQTAMPQTTTCPALFIAAPASGQGKTTVTAAIARYFCHQGLDVRVFKTGPDYLDPQILAQASGHPVAQLDLWMGGLTYCQQALFTAAEEADLILVEGVMGLFDGDPSGADLAATFGIPIALLMDVSGMAQTAAAIATGLSRHRSDIQFAGVIANRCGSDYHASLIANDLPPTLPLLAVIPRDEQITLPERHLGLVQAQEMSAQLEPKLNRAAEILAQRGELNLPTAITFYAPISPNQENTPAGIPDNIDQPLQGKIIAVARDAAFSFIYQANLDLLAECGAQLAFFSPLTDTQLPQADALWLPGGYPELHAQTLMNNHEMCRAIQAFHQHHKPILAECGGMLYCLEGLTNLEGQRVNMLGLIEGEGRLRERGGCQGMQTAILPEGEVRAHAHHRSQTEATPEPISFGRRQKHPAPGEAIYRKGSLTATYLHLYFPSNPLAITQLFSS